MLHTLDIVTDRNMRGDLLQQIQDGFCFNMPDVILMLLALAVLHAQQVAFGLLRNSLKMLLFTYTFSITPDGSFIIAFPWRFVNMQIR